MRFFVKSLFAIILAALISGALTYPTWLLISQFGDVRPDRVMRRIGMIVLAITLVMVLRRARLANRQTLGYGLPRAKFLRHLAFGFGAGLLLMLPIVGGLFGAGIRVWNAPATSEVVVKFLTESILRGLVVACIEETFLRGAMFSVIQRESGILWAIALPSLLYAAVHFLGGSLRIDAGSMDWMGGLRIAADLFSRFTTPGEFADSFLALLALGVLLSLLRLRTGAIAASIGVHAGGVCVITLLHNISVANPAAAAAWLVGSYDGVIGWLMLFWIGAVTLVYWRLSDKTKRSD